MAAKPTPSSTDEISEPINGGASVVVESFSKRLRAALEALSDGQALDIRTVAERQQIANIISTLQKKQSVKYETTVLRKRIDDPEGKIALRIKRLGALPPKEQAPTQ